MIATTSVVQNPAYRLAVATPTPSPIERVGGEVFKNIDGLYIHPIPSAMQFPNEPSTLQQ